MEGIAFKLTEEESDYGSDLCSDQDVSLTELLQATPSKDLGKPILLKDIEDSEGSRTARLPRVLGRGPRSHGVELIHSGRSPKGSAEKSVPVEITGYRSVSAPVESQESRMRRDTRGASAEPTSSPTPEPTLPDLRSPLERFRTKPKKALSVTDLVSPTWCELQYWYVLTKYGRKRRTPAMKQGSKVHQKLEDQVHRTIEVKIERKEDAWGLRIWNIIQGLRTLRDTGITRELELWGIIDGQVVNGVIDELSYICPDRELEEASEKPKRDDPPEGQATIDDFFRQNNGHSIERGALTRLSDMRKKTSRIYLTDVKTRGLKSVPKGASFRPTLMQLLLYHRLLSELATDKVDPNALFARYDLQPVEHFSDDFIAQIGNLNEVYYDAPDDPSQTNQPEIPAATQDSMQVLLENNSLTKLWQLMMEEFRRTLPDGAKSIGKVLNAEYRGQIDGEITGVKTFLYDDRLLQDYLDDEMKWWKGEREAKGVDIQEAFKCGYCEFANECTWRKTKVEEATEAHRKQYLSTRTKSSV